MRWNHIVTDFNGTEMLSTNDLSALESLHSPQIVGNFVWIGVAKVAPLTLQRLRKVIGLLIVDA